MRKFCQLILTEKKSFLEHAVTANNVWISIPFDSKESAIVGKTLGKDS
jgi:hypothetical protein